MIGVSWMLVRFLWVWVFFWGNCYGILNLGCLKAVIILFWKVDSGISQN